MVHGWGDARGRACVAPVAVECNAAIVGVGFG